MISSQQSVTASSQTASEIEPKELVEARKVLLQNMLNGSLIIATILFFINLYSAIQNANYFNATIFLLAFSAIFLVTFSRNLPFNVRVSILAGGYFIVGLISMIQSGMSANGLFYFLISALIVALLEPKQYWLFPLAGVAITISLLGFLIQRGIINSGDFIVENNSVLVWVSISIIFLYIVFLLSTTLSGFLQNLQKQLITTTKTNEILTSENDNLSSRLTEYEKMSDRRRSRLVTTRQISRELSQETDLDKLLHNSVELIRSQLGYYHAAIFLNDERNENALLRAATGETGRLMLDRKYRIRIHDEGVVGFVIAKGEARTTFDIAQDSMHPINPALPNTRSEMALPLRVGTRIFGALDIQSDQIETFGEEDVEVLQSIADQLSTSIDKTMQIQTLEQKVTNLEEGYRSYTRGIWQSHLKGSKKQLNYVYKQDTLGTDYQQSEAADDALLRGEAIISTPKADTEPENTESEIAVPITLRNQTLGVLNIKYKGTEIPSELVDLVNTASDRLALALENARLLEQIQERAQREHLVGEISSKVRSASDIDTILRTTVTELGKSLGIDEVRIQLKSGE
jgi:GAF domain-containing protein